MATTKVTFTLDQPTIACLEQAADRLRLPKSAVVREAIHELAERIGKLSEREKLKMLRTFDEFVPAIPARDARSVRRELQELRQARRSGGRRS